MFLMSVQQPKILYIAGVFSLDMETCLKVYFVISFSHNNKMFAKFRFLFFLDIKINLLVCNDFEHYDVSKRIGHHLQLKLSAISKIAEYFG